MTQWHNNIMDETSLSVLNVERYADANIPPYRHMERMHSLRTANIAMS